MRTRPEAACGDGLTRTLEKVKPAPPPPAKRIDLIDALRGSALAGILLLHAVEHWDFLRYPESASPLIQRLDRIVHDAGFFLFGGKAYAIFAMMFGVSFFIILDRWAQRGIPFHGRFTWRLALLGLFGYLHGILYCGDILRILAVLGLPLVLLYRLKNRVLLAIAVVLLLQLPSAWEAYRVVFEEGYVRTQPQHWTAYGELFNAYANGTFLEVTALNAGRGQLASLLFTIETGRYTQMMGLFVLGLLLGRARLLENAERAKRLAKHALLWGAVGFAVLLPISLRIGHWGLDGMQRYTVGNLVNAYLNLTQLSLWVGLFIWLYQRARIEPVLRLLAPYGRMSLTGYVMQGAIGVPLFYGWGLGLYRDLGIFWSVVLGAGILAFQLLFAHLWLKRFAYGPLEWLWRSLTFLTLATPLRRRTAAVALAG